VAVQHVAIEAAYSGTIDEHLNLLTLAQVMSSLSMVNALPCLWTS
jgi:hypothetical protein